MIAPDPVDPALYARFAAGIRAQLRHKAPEIDQETGVDQVLASITAAMQRGEFSSERMLLSRIRERVNALVAQQKARNQPETAQCAGNRAIDIAMMHAEEREVLKRFYVLGQPETQIGREMNLRPDAIREIKRRARQTYRVNTPPPKI